MADTAYHENEKSSQKPEAELKKRMELLRRLCKAETGLHRIREESKKMKEERRRLVGMIGSGAAANAITARACRVGGRIDDAEDHEAVAKKMLAEPEGGVDLPRLWEEVVVHLLSLPMEKCKERFKVLEGLDEDEFWGDAEKRVVGLRGLGEEELAEYFRKNLEEEEEEEEDEDE
ncbi:uncharacterized protein LTR77_004921 [Saxophila tyrrhenica]|uniref:Uncharacterized protein n=1 Tax=Saxophila tyrrhenica TaxID=1690608 RepID=A0AAV9PAV1_9PEZI|nr:hypothetical protein LTR77_004921 [Saxophila tyrrhenica]